MSARFLEKCTKTDLFDVPPCQNMVRGHFMMGAVHKSKLTCGKCRSSRLSSHSPFGVPQAIKNAQKLI